MAVVTGPLTTFMGIPIPGENSDPFYDQFLEYSRTIDLALHNLSMTQNSIISGGGSISWAAGSGLLSWTDDIYAPMFKWGYKLVLRYGPDNTTRNANISNGSALVVTLPASLNGNRILNLTVESSLPAKTNAQWVLAWNNNGTLVFRDLGEFT